MRFRFMHLTFLLIVIVILSACGGSSSQSNTASTGQPTKPPGFMLGDWTWRSPLPQGRSLFSAAYGHGKVVSVGEFGTILNSDNGNVSLSGINNDLYSVTFGNGTFVTVGKNGAILTSSEGTIWTSHPVDLGNGGFSSVIYGNNRFVAVGTVQQATVFGVIYTSDDNGITWSRQLVTPQVSFDRVVIANNQFFATTRANFLYASPDGITWTQRQIPDSFVTVIYAQGKYVAINSTGTVYSSADAVTWSRCAYINSLLNGMAFSNSTLVIVDWKGAIYTSSDAQTWTQHQTTFTLGINDIIYAGGKFTAIGSAGRVLESIDDGLTWTEKSSRVTDIPIKSIAYGNDIFLATASDPYTRGISQLWKSVNAIQWVQLSLPALDMLNSVKFINGRFYLLCQNSVYASQDAANWTQIISGLNASYNDVIYANGTYVIVGGNQHIMTSTDGTTWTERWQGPSWQGFTKAIFAKNRFVVIGGFGKIVTSQDGILWSDASIYASDDFNGIAYGQGQFVVVGDNGTVYISSDGISWTNKQYGYFNSLKDIIFTQDGFVAVGYAEDEDANDYCYLKTSKDGINWNDGILSVKGWLFGVTYAQNSYVVVGNYILQAFSTYPFPVEKIKASDRQIYKTQ